VVAVLAALAAPIASRVTPAGGSSGDAFTAGFLDVVLMATTFVIGPLFAVGAVVVGIWLLAQRRSARGSITLLAGLLAASLSWQSVAAASGPERPAVRAPVLDRAIRRALSDEGIVVRNLLLVEGGDRSVTISGEVPDSSARQRVQAAIEELPGVTRVVNLLVVQP
jgi:hypothetical protein